ncbi:MAG: flagellar basal-body MS-ring/collar protein FliF [Pacificimonas sp.]
MFINDIGPRRAALMGGITLIIVLGLAMLAMRGTSGPMAYLYTDLDAASAAAIADRLQTEQVPYEIADNGLALMVPAARVADLRMSLAGEQIGGAIGYEVLDREDAFGTSAAKSRINRTRAIEGELARSIETITTISRARVHINMPERALFERDRQPASASVTLRTAGSLAPGQVDAIRALVSSAVPGLDAAAISIVDQSGALLARAGDADGAGGMARRQVAIENRLRGEIEALLGRVVGAGKVRANVAAELELDDIREESETYDPDMAVLQHQTTVEKEDQDSETSALGGPVSISTQLPENQSTAEQEARRRSANEVSEEMVWANSATRTTRIRQGGALKRLSVSVVVDGSYVDGGYSARPQAELQRLQNLVQNAIGFDESRGDSVVVENLRFAEIEGVDAPIAGMPFGLTKSDILPVVRTAILGLIGLAALIVLLRSLKPGTIDRIKTLPALTPETDDAKMKRLLERAAQGDDEALTQLQAMRGDTRAPIEQEIDLAQIEGRLKSTAVRKVGDVVEKSPRESAAIIRQWMYS